jgi:hypothetical protein
MKHRLAIFLVLLLSLTAIFSSATFLVTSPRPSQPFMGLGVYSPNGLEGYVIGANQTVGVNQTLDWTVAVTNNMGTPQFTQVIVLLGNVTTATPNATSPASLVPEIGEMEQFVNDGATSNLNFTWAIQSTNQTGGLVFLKLVINGQQPSDQFQIGAVSGQNFRLIFELWSFDSATQSFEYGYAGIGGTVGTWLQVWFNAST